MQLSPQVVGERQMSESLVILVVKGSSVNPFLHLNWNTRCRKGSLQFDNFFLTNLHKTHTCIQFNLVSINYHSNMIYSLSFFIQNNKIQASVMACALSSPASTHNTSDTKQVAQWATIAHLRHKVPAIKSI